jgi:cation diffusion facilitator family transporter
MAGSHGTKAILAAFFANLGIAIAKFVGFLFTGSGSMLAESVHSVADTSNQALLLVGGRRARRLPSAIHPFGYGRERYFWSFVVAVVLFTLGSAFALIEGYEKLRHPHEVESPAWAVVILCLAIGLETFSFRTAVQESRPLKGDAGWWAFIRRSKVPELPVVLLEDLAALLGLVLALAAVLLTAATDDTTWDAAGTLAIGTLLGIVAAILAIEMRSLLIGESATPEMQARVVDAIVRTDGVQSLIHLRTQHIGPEELLVAAKVEFDPALSMAGLAGAVDAVEAAIRADEPAARVIYIEPDLRRTVSPA